MTPSSFPTTHVYRFSGMGMSCNIFSTDTITPLGWSLMILLEGQWLKGLVKILSGIGGDVMSELVSPQQELPTGMGQELTVMSDENQ